MRSFWAVCTAAAAALWEAAPEPAGGCGGCCAAAAGQPESRRQNHSSKTFVFHGGAPFYKAPDTGGVCPGQTGGCLVILCRFVPEHNSGHVGLALNHRAVDADELCLGAIRIVQQFIYKNPNGSILARILIFQSHHLLGRRFGDAGSSCQTVLAAILFSVSPQAHRFPLKQSQSHWMSAYAVSR